MPSSLYELYLYHEGLFPLTAHSVLMERADSPVPSSVMPSPLYELYLYHEGLFPLTAHSVLMERADSPVPSCVSLKSDRSIGIPINFREGPFPTDQSVLMERADSPVPSSVMPSPLYELYLYHEGLFPLTAHSVLMERADSPVPSCVSLKSDRSIGIPINFREGPFPTDQSVLMERADSPVPSCVSLKSDRSIGIPINFREGPFPTDQSVLMERADSPVPSSVMPSPLYELYLYHEGLFPLTAHSVLMERADSPVPSCVSLKSDRSIGIPINFREGPFPTDQSVLMERADSPVPSSVMPSPLYELYLYHEGLFPLTAHSVLMERADSPVPSCVSLKSDRSIGIPINFREGPFPTDQSVLMERADSPVPSCVSLKSDRSIGIPINFIEGPFPTDQSVLMERADSPVPSCVSLKSDRSIGIPINFREGPFPTDQRDQMEECSSDLHDKSDLSAISKSLQEKAVKFLKDELKKFVRYLDQNYPECSEPQLEEDNDLDSDGQMQKTCGREGALKITLYILRTMKQNDLADMLEKRLMLQYQREIKRKLKKQFECVFEGKAKEGQPTLLSEIYTELYITEGGTGEVNDEHEVRQIETASKKRRTEDTTVKCNDIFKPLCGRETPIRSVLSKGVAGIGKTVSVQKFILDWAEGKANQDVHFIFALPFRDLNLIKDEYSLIELLHRFVPELKSFQSIELFRYKVLFIFDGLDECRLPLDFQNNESWFDVTKKMSLDVLLTNLIKGNLLPSALLWITSRPAASNQIPPKCVHRVTEIRGFSDAQKEEYFRRRFSDESLASRIITHVKSSRSLFIMCHIPVFCWISATVLERLFSETDRGEIPRTLTEMYTHFLIFQASLKIDKYSKNDETKLNEYSKEFLLKLGKLAFDNLEKGNLIFYEQDLTENGIDVAEASVYSGVCTEVFKEEYGLYREKVYCFVHLSIQEYLAALYVFLSNSSADLLKTAVDQALESKNGHLDLYLRFLLGLSTDSSRTLLQKLLGETRIGSHTIKEMEQYIHPSNVCPPVSSGLLGTKAFPQSSMPMAWNNPGWDASLSQPQYIHPSNVCHPVCSGPLGTKAFPQSSMPMAWNNPGWDASLSQPQYIHPSNVCHPVCSGPLGTKAFPQSSMPMAWNNPGWDASLSQPQYIHPSNVCHPVCSGLLGTKAFPQSSMPMAWNNPGWDASLSQPQYIHPSNVCHPVCSGPLGTKAFPQSSMPMAWNNPGWDASLSQPQYIHPSNVCHPVCSGPLGTKAFPQSSVPMAWNNPGWDASLSQPQYIHPSNVCHPVCSGPLGTKAFPQSSVPMAWNNPGWDASLSQPQYIHPSNVCHPVCSGPLGTKAFPQSSMPMAWNNPGWDASLSQPQYIHPSNVCHPVCSGPLGTKAFPQSSMPMTGTDLELGASLSLAEYIKKKIQKKLSPERTINLFHCLVELGDSSLIQEVQRYLNSGSLSAEDLSPAQYSALAFVMLMSDEELDVFDMKKYIRSDEEHWRLLPVVKNSRTALLKSCGLTNEHCEMLTSALRSNSSPLRELDLSDNDLKNKGVMLLFAGLGDSHCKLGLLRLSSCRVTEDGCSSLASALRSNPSHLRELDLSYNDLHDSGVKLLSAVLEDPSCKLEALRLSGCRVTEEGCSSLASALRSNPSHLRELDLSDNDLQDSGVKLLSAVLEEPSCKLEKLKMSGCRVTEEGCSSLASALRSNPSHLRELDLSYNHPGDSGVKLLSAVLEDPSCKLEKLKVNRCELTEKCCEVLISALRSNSSPLRELDLSDNDLQDSGVKLLSAGLGDSHCKLEILRLSGCRVTEEGCSSLALALRSNPSHLRELDLSYNHPGDSGVKLLSAVLEDPSCKLEKLNVDHGGECRTRPGVQRYSCQLTLDPNTANRLLSLSGGDRKVTRGAEEPYPDHPERFDSRPQVLCRESLTGRCYWEAEWDGDVALIGVTYKGIRRKGGSDCVIGFNNKSWCLRCDPDSYSVWHNNKQTLIPIWPSGSRRVGVYLDWGAGALSFYRVSSDGLTPLYRFTCSFTESLYPGFYVHNSSVSL
ncbi:uncharacterized protein LOC125726904 isoform X8 [Brienomyrus brachyistius]|uniref:uncharacterized protein LOC125726904 isoform X8 n=1 Tax=Brienomyrus brachyistius TaxID=42636 RepID=UPI0020B36E39|nr:uncharacterized protein LOC125726904 isoform X8 [Brienomyrus brachyistius]